MMDATRIHSFNSFVRMMYAYSTPEIARHDGWLKIGDTRQGVDERIGQQTHTADVLYELQWRDIAMYRDDCTFFRDYQFHDFLTGYKGIERNDHTEWFRIDGQTLRQYFEEFATRDYQPKALHCSYTLRREQEDAVGRTLAYLTKTGGEGKYLWNAKPREVIERIESDRAQRKKADIEEEVRAHLRGFARTIPSFIMAYDDGQLTLDNFDQNIEDEVFREFGKIAIKGT